MSVGAGPAGTAAPPPPPPPPDGAHPGGFAWDRMPPPREIWARVRPGPVFWGRAAFGLLVLLFLVVLTWHRIFITIPPGHVGVLWLRFFGGTVQDFHFREGTKAIFPWDRIYLYTSRLQRLDHVTTALTREGLPVTMEITVGFVVNPEKVATLHTSVGPDYVRRMVDPVIAAAIRERIADGRPEQIYAVAHRAIEDDIAEGIQKKLGEMTLNRQGQGLLVRVADFSVRGIALPATVRQSIEDKLAAEQAVQRYRLSIDQERLEAERRAIEAEGIRRFQEIVSPAISDSFLRWRGIEATVALSQSPNAKIVVIGSGASGMPLILDGRGEGGPMPPPPPAATVGAPPVPAPPPPTAVPASLGDRAVPSDAPQVTPPMDGLPAGTPLPPDVEALPAAPRTRAADPPTPPGPQGSTARPPPPSPGQRHGLLGLPSVPTPALGTGLSATMPR